MGWPLGVDDNAAGLGGALGLSVGASLLVALINAVVGTLIAWVLVRDAFRDKALVSALIDLPFALPTIVAGLTVIAMFGVHSPLGINVAYTRITVELALLLVTLPFVVRAVQPTLAELDLEMEQARTHGRGVAAMKSWSETTSLLVLTG